MAAPLLAPGFFARDTVLVARALLGQRLVRVIGDQRLSGLITETEAYRGPDDQASHAFRLTRRSAIMYGPPGRAYVYVIYGRNFCLNAVTEADGVPGAVLIRAIVPEEGVATMAIRRGVDSRAKQDRLVGGPGKMCQALGIDLSQNGVDLTQPGELAIESGPGAPGDEVSAGPRVGVRGDTETRARPWRFIWRPVSKHP